VLGGLADAAIQAAGEPAGCLIDEDMLTRSARSAMIVRQSPYGVLPYRSVAKPSCPPGTT
jgi:hypothetical protein